MIIMIKGGDAKFGKEEKRRRRGGKNGRDGENHRQLIADSGFRTENEGYLTSVLTSWVRLRIARACALVAKRIVS